MATALSFLSGRQITDANGVPQSGALLYHYQANTTSNLTVYSNQAGTTPHAQPVVCDAGGFVPLIYVDSTSDWKVVIQSALAATLKTYDNLPKAPVTASAANFAAPLLTWNQRVFANSPVSLASADAGNAYEADTSSGSITFNLPSAASVGNGKGFVFKKTASANSLIIDPNGTETIDDNSANFTLTRQYDTIGIFSNGAEWYQVFDINPQFTTGFAQGLSIVNNATTPTTQIDITCDVAAIPDTVGRAIRHSTISVTLNAATVGANGIDAGSLANSTWYYIYLISNGTTVASLLSTSATAPTMPSGYLYKYRIGAQRTGGAATFNRLAQKGNRAQYVVVSGSVTPNLPQMVSGASGSTTVPTWTSVATGNFVPTTAVRIMGLISGTNGTTHQVMAAPNNQYGAYNSSSNPPPVAFASDPAAAQALGKVPFEFVLESANIFYAASAGGTFMNILGWIDSVNAC